MTVRKHYRKSKVQKGGGQKQPKTFGQKLTKVLVPSFVRKGKSITGIVFNKGLNYSLAEQRKGKEPIAAAGVVGTVGVGVPLGLAVDTLRVGVPTTLKTLGKTASGFTGIGLSAPKAVLQGAITTPIAVARTLWHSPGVAYNVLQKRSARAKVVKSIGFDKAQILSKLNKFDTMKKTIEDKKTALTKLITNRVGKIDPNKVQAKEEKYKAQIEQLDAQQKIFMETTLQKLKPNEYSSDNITKDNFITAITNLHTQKKTEYDNKILDSRRKKVQNANNAVAAKQQEITNLTGIPDANKTLVQKAQIAKATRELKSLQAKATIKQAKLSRLSQSKSVNALERKLAERKAISNAKTARLKAAATNIIAPITTLKEGAQAGLKFSKSVEKVLTGNTGIKSAGQTLKESVSELGSAMFKPKTTTTSNLQYMGRRTFKNPVKYIRKKKNDLVNTVKKSFTERIRFQTTEKLKKINGIVGKRLENAQTNLTEVRAKLATNTSNNNKATLLKQQRELEAQINKEQILKAKIEKKLSKSNTSATVAYKSLKAQKAQEVLNNITKPGSNLASKLAALPDYILPANLKPMRTTESTYIALSGLKLDDVQTALANIRSSNDENVKIARNYLNALLTTLPAPVAPAPAPAPAPVAPAPVAPAPAPAPAPIPAPVAPVQVPAPAPVAPAPAPVAPAPVAPAPVPAPAPAQQPNPAQPREEQLTAISQARQSGQSAPAPAPAQAQAPVAPAQGASDA